MLTQVNFGHKNKKTTTNRWITAGYINAQFSRGETEYFTFPQG